MLTLRNKWRSTLLFDSRCATYVAIATSGLVRFQEYAGVGRIESRVGNGRGVLRAWTNQGVRAVEQNGALTEVVMIPLFQNFVRVVNAK